MKTEQKNEINRVCYQLDSAARQLAVTYLNDDEQDVKLKLINLSLKIKRISKQLAAIPNTNARIGDEMPQL